MNYFLILISSAVVSLLSVILVRKFAIHFKIGSLPSPRKLHKGFVPLLGGLGFLSGIISAIIIAQNLEILPLESITKYKYFWIGLVFILLTGMFDDIKGISSRIKFLGQAAAAILLIIGGCKIQTLSGPMGEVLDLGIFAIPFTFLWIILITFFLHIIFTDGRILIQIPGIGFNITYEGFYNGTFYGFRILLLLAFSNLFMLTTSPIDITDGMELLFNPLKKLKIPIDKFALIISISLRFIPTIFEETERIKKAQVARGAGIEKSIIKRLKKITTIIIPVFISIFRRADELAVALETRWYPPIGKRTYYRDINLKTKDFLVLFAIFFISGGVLFLDKYLFR